MKPKQIIKEGLSEYFIYTIEGTETIPNGWSKRMRSFEGTTVPFKIQYRYRPAEYGDQLVRMYLLTNDKESKLGTTPLPDGMVRVFRQNGRDGLSFLVGPADQVHPHRRQDRAEPRAAIPNVIFELVKLRDAAATTSGCSSTGPTSSSRSARPSVQIEVNSSVVGWDDHDAVQPAGAQLHGQADRPGDPPDASPATSSSAASWRPRTSTTRRSSTPPR